MDMHRGLLALSPALRWVLATALFFLPFFAVSEELASSTHQQSSAFSPLYLNERAKSIAAIQAEQWSQASTLSEELLEMARNPYETIDALQLLLFTLRREDRHEEAIRIIDGLIAKVDNSVNGPHFDQMDLYTTEGLISSFLAKNVAVAERYSHRMLKDARLFPEQWNTSFSQHHITDSASGLSMPLTAGRWLLVHMEPASKPGNITRWKYLYVAADATTAEVKISMQHPDDMSGLDDQARRHKLFNRLRPRFDDEIPVDGATLPDMALPGLLQASLRSQVTIEGTAMQRARWLGYRSGWLIGADLTSRTDGIDTMLQALPSLWSAIDWSTPIELDAQWPERDRMIEELWTPSGSNQKAAALAASSLAIATFPRDAAVLNAIIGITAFREGDDTKAATHLAKALRAWEYIGADRFEAQLKDDSLQYAAALSFIANDSPRGASLMNRYLDYPGRWAEPWFKIQDGNSLVLRNKHSDMQVPVWLSGFLAGHPKSDAAIVFKDLRTGQIVGLTTNLDVPASDTVQEQLFREVMNHQFNLTLGSLQQQPFQASTHDSSILGKRWTFQVEAGFHNDVTQVTFWVVDRGTTRTLLRASTKAPEELLRAEEFAKALVW
ncbi:hypothetical protein [Stenotrophomonas sp. SY1]|uniref:hypothetical protein n=1 Tax=Stenotrophomonas sp. SY1 TaxID=477235 RepID=UPI001E2FAAC8|nr:hypothetical protein [Stenotrophomonas sp. SY1]MCD9085606.1 hypothetical protein [Stenotrophomonas sp. SY1]